MTSKRDTGRHRREPPALDEEIDEMTSNARRSWWVRLFSDLDGRTVGLLLALFVVVALLWGTVIVAPLKIFVVLLHEISHGLAAIATGGSIERIEINAQQGGLAFTRGGSRFVTLTAGYLGSMLWGGVILLTASRTKLDRYLSIGIGGFLLLVTLLYVRTTFGFAFSLVFGGAMVAMGLLLSDRVNDLVLRLIGLTSCLYAVLDILDDVLRRPGIGSDADMLAELTGVPSLVWGVLWMAAAVAATTVFLALSAKRLPGKPGAPTDSLRP
jgi:hypothetical protein